VGGARLVIQEGHFAEDRTRAEDRKDDFSPVLPREDHLYLTLGHQIEGVTPITLYEDEATPVHGFLPEDPRKGPKLVLGEGREEGDFAENVEGRQ
jgi:hypothetical protein